MSVVNVVCCQVEVNATNRSLVQRSPTDCAVSGCDREASKMRRPCPTGGCCAREIKKTVVSSSILDVHWQNHGVTGLTYLLTPRSRVPIAKLKGPQLTKKFPAFYGTRRFIIAFTTARHLS